MSPADRRSAAGAVDGPGRRVAGSDQIADVRRIWCLVPFCSCSLARLMPAWMSVMTDGNDAMACRMSLGRAVHGVEQRTALARAPTRRHVRHPPKPVCRPLTALSARSRAALMLRSANASRSLAAATLPDDRSQCRSVEFVVQLGQSLFCRGDARGEFDILPGQPVEQ